MTHLVNCTLRFLDGGGAAKLNHVLENSSEMLDASPCSDDVRPPPPPGLDASSVVGEMVNFLGRALCVVAVAVCLG